MQNEMLDPSLQQGSFHHVNLPAQPVSGPLSHLPRSSAAEPETVDPNRARKVAEVFLTAGHAFQKLGDLAMQLHVGPSSLPSEEKWNENNVEHLREALTRFAHELDQISNNVQARTTRMISTDIRRRHAVSQRPPVASAISAFNRQPNKLGPVMVPKRLNVARNTRQYMPAHLAAAPAVQQIVVPVTKTYPVTRAGTSSFTGQRQYVMSMPQAGPSRSIPIVNSHISNQPPGVHSHNNSVISHQGPPALVPVVMEDVPPRLDQRI